VTVYTCDDADVIVRSVCPAVPPIWDEDKLDLDNDTTWTI